MATRTVDRDSACRCHHLRHDVVEIVSPGESFQDGTGRFGLSDKIPGTSCQESSRCDSIGIVRTQNVARNLVTQEMIVGHVSIERPDHPIAIMPGVVATLITFKPVRVGVMGNVQPVPCPPFSVMFRRQQTIDESFHSHRGGIVDKRIDVFRCWRQSVEIERQPANQCATISFRR